MRINYKNCEFSLKLLAIYLAINSVCVMASEVTYQVQKGDTLSDILFDHGLSPLYGKNGFVKLTTILNCNKTKKDGNIVRVGGIIKLPMPDEVPEEIERKVATIETQEKNKEITIESRAPNEEFPYSHFVYSPHLSFLRIDSNNDTKFGGSSAAALSKSGVGFGLAWHIFWDDRFSFFGFGSLDHFSLYKDPNYSLNNLSITHFNFGVGENYNYSQELKFTSKITLREVSFLDVITPTTVNLESIAVPEVEMGFEKTIFTQKKLSGFWGTHISALLPGSRGSYKSKFGYGVGATVGVIHRHKALFLSYDLRSQHVNEIKNKESIIVLGMNFFERDVP